MTALTLADGVSLRAAIDEAEREYKMRQTHYPRFVEQQKLTRERADMQLRAQQDIITILRWLANQG